MAKKRRGKGHYKHPSPMSAPAPVPASINTLIGQYSDYTDVSALTDAVSDTPLLDSIREEMVYRLAESLNALVHTTGDTTTLTAAGIRAALGGRPEWQPMHYYRRGDTIYDLNTEYVAVVEGTSGLTAPTLGQYEYTSDGTAVWGQSGWNSYRVGLSASSAREPASDPVEVRVAEESSDRKVRL